MAKKIFIDAGHGGKDSGAVGNGLKEKDLTLRLALKTRDYLKQYSGADVRLSRETDVYLSLDQRTDAANSWGADLLVSIHINAATPSAEGFESFVYTKVDDATKAFQNVLHKAVLKASGLDDRGQRNKDLHMCRESKMPAVLTENGFISNAGDALKMKIESWLNKIAEAHATGIAEFAGLKKITAPPTAPTKKGKIYRVQVGAFEDKENAEALVADLTKQGYRPFVFEE